MGCLTQDWLPGAFILVEEQGGRKGNMYGNSYKGRYAELEFIPFYSSDLPFLPKIITERPMPTLLQGGKLGDSHARLGACPAASE